VSIAAATMYARDGGTGAHSDDVVHLCDAIAEELGVYGHDRAELLAAAQLHDVGKAAIPQDVLDKSGPLDDREWALIRDHTVAGEQIVDSVPELHDVARLVRHSHERWDGGGYPDGLSGEQIPLASRIVFCADAFHAIRSDRPYRQGRTARAALDEVELNAGSQFDPDVAEALVKAAGQLSSATSPDARGLPATLRSRRVMSLLLTLAIGGSALAAGGFHWLRGESDTGARKAVSTSGSTHDPGGDGSTPEAGSATKLGWPGKSGFPTANQARRSDAGVPRSASSTRAPDGQANSLAGRRRRTARTPPVGAPGAPPAVPRRRRAPGPASPGRSAEAPRRPAQPGKPIGGAPGRSEEAPGRPSEPVNPPAARSPGDAANR